MTFRRHSGRLLNVMVSLSLFYGYEIECGLPELSESDPFLHLEEYEDIL